MAELHVQRKERSVWPWILVAVIILALLFWFLWGRNDGVDVGRADVTDTSMVGTVPNTDLMGSSAGTAAGPSVTQYLQFVDARSSGAANMSHDYTSDGLRQLAAALTEIASGDSVGGVALQPRIDAIRERADAMQRNPTSTGHALQAREAFTLASSLMAQMSSKIANIDAGSLEGLQKAAMAIEPSRPLLDQVNQIEQFFSQAAQAVRNMTR